MKRALQAVAVCLLLSMGANAVTLEEFRKLSPRDRLRAMEYVPPELKEVFRKADLHQYLIESNGGEEGYKWMKERYLIVSRELGPLLAVFEAQVWLWQAYLGAFAESQRDSGTPKERQVAQVQAVSARLELLRKRQYVERPKPSPGSEAFGGSTGTDKKGRRTASEAQ